MKRLHLKWLFISMCLHRPHGRKSQIAVFGWLEALIVWSRLTKHCSEKPLQLNLINLLSKNRKMFARGAIPKGYNVTVPGSVALLNALIFSKLVYLLLFLNREKVVVHD